MLNRSHIEKKIYKTLKEYLCNMGFDFPNFDKCIKYCENYHDEVTFRVVTIGFDFGISYIVTRCYYLIEEDLSRLTKEYESQPMNSTIWLTRTRLKPELEDTSKSHLLKNGGIYLKSSDIDNEVEKFKNTFIDEYENLISPFLKQTENIHWMDEILNTNPMDFDEPCKYFPYNGLIFKKIIIAKLAGNTNYENIYSTFFDLYNNFLQENDDEESKKQFEVLKIVYERLKNVSQLENPSLV